MFAFAHPWVFALLPLAWLARALLPPRRVRYVAVRVPFGDRLRAAGGEASSSANAVRRRRPPASALIVWALVVTACARPQWVEPPVTQEVPTRDLLLLVDLSGSMSHEDFVNAAGETVDRLTAVKEVLGDFLARRDGDRVGLIVFGDAPFLQAPFSTDLGLSQRLLNETAIGMAGPRTAFGDAIGLGINQFEGSDAPAKTMIALTDGNDTKSQLPPVEAARVAAQRDIRVHTVAIGDPSAVGEEKLDEVTLRQVAEATGGSYFFAGDREQLEGIYDELDRIETREVNVISHRPRRDLFHVPLLAALALSLGAKSLGLLARSRGASPASAPASVRVDPLSGKLEVRT